MPFDGTSYQPEMSLEEKALRHALAFFTGPEKWSQGKAHRLDGSKCIGAVMKEVIREDTGWFAGPTIQRALGVRNPPHWNDGLPDLAALESQAPRAHKALRRPAHEGGGVTRLLEFLALTAAWAVIWAAAFMFGA